MNKSETYMDNITRTIDFVAELLMLIGKHAKIISLEECADCLMGASAAEIATRDFETEEARNAHITKKVKQFKTMLETSR